MQSYSMLKACGIYRTTGLQRVKIHYFRRIIIQFIGYVVMSLYSFICPLHVVKSMLFVCINVEFYLEC
jgi:hypothetical protein